MKHYYKAFLVSLFVLQGSSLLAQISSSVELGGQAGTGKNAPFFHTANKYGASTIDVFGGYLRGSVLKEMNVENENFDWGAGIDLIGSTGNYYSVFLQQFYVEGKWKMLDAMIGMKEYNHSFQNQRLSSGSLVWSGNSRPIAEARIGIFDFYTIPGTNGWLQIKGELSFGRMIENKYLRHTFNYLYGGYATDIWHHNKNIYFRSKENKPFILTLSAQLTTEFGGHTRLYDNGLLYHEQNAKPSLRSFWQAFFPSAGDMSASVADQQYYYGNTLGSWSAQAEYKFRNQSRLHAYFEWFFEDASGMGKMNGFDGLWGLEYDLNSSSIISNILIEYLQTTNQGGPIHFSPTNDNNGSVIQGSHATGHDNYYVHQFYNGWSHQGMTIGNPLIQSPVYNKNGYLQTLHNRIKAVHVGIGGHFSRNLDYRLLANYLISWGTFDVPVMSPVHNASAMIELSYQNPRLKGFRFTGSTSFDQGKLYGDNWGVSLSIRKVFNINCNK